MKPRPVDKPAIPIASLIDIVFLLIIFFLVTSEFDKDAVDETIRLAESYFVDPVTKRDPRTITINVQKISSTRSIVKIAGISLSLNDLKGILAKARVQFGETIPVVIRADGEISFQNIDQVMNTVTGAGLHRISLASKRIVQ